MAGGRKTRVAHTRGRGWAKAGSKNPEEEQRRTKASSEAPWNFTIPGENRKNKARISTEIERDRLSYSYSYHAGDTRFYDLAFQREKTKPELGIMNGPLKLAAGCCVSSFPFIFPLATETLFRELYGLKFFVFRNRAV